MHTLGLLAHGGVIIELDDDDRRELELAVAAINKLLATVSAGRAIGV